MLVSYDKTTKEITNIISKFKKLPEVSEEVKKSLSSLDIDDILNNENIEEYVKEIRGGTDDVVKFASAIKDGSFKLKEGQSMLEGYQVYMKGLSKQTSIANLKTKALSVSMKALSSIGWMAIISLATWAIGKGIEAIDNYVHRVEKAKESIENITNEVSEINSKLKNTEKSVNDYAQRFAELSQGIDSLTGKNLSLNTDDYEDFLELSNQMAELFPSLSRIYDENGNAIVQLSGNVDTIVGSLNNLVQVERDLANQQIVNKLPELYENTKTISEDYKDNLDELNAEYEYYQNLLNGVKNFNLDKMEFDDLGNIKTATENLNGFYEVLYKIDPSMSTYSFLDTINEHGQREIYEMAVRGSDRFTQLLKENEEQIPVIIKSLEDEYNRELKRISGEISTTKISQKSNWNNLNQSISAWLYSDDSTSTWGDNLLSSVQKYINEINWEDLKLKDFDDVESYILTNIINPINGNEQIKNLYIKLFSLEDGDLRRIDIAKQLQKALNEAGVFDFNVMPIVADEQEAKDKLDKSLSDLSGLSTNSKMYDTKVSNRFLKQQQKTYDELQKATETFTASQIDTWLKWYSRNYDSTKSVQENMSNFSSWLITFNSNYDSFDDIFAFKDANGTINKLGELSEQLDKIQSAYDSLNSAMENYASTGHITIDQFQSILEQGDDFLDYLKLEEGSLSLDKQAMYALAESRIVEMKARMIQGIVNNVIGIQNEEAASNYLKSTNYDLADSYKVLAKAQLEAWYSSDSAQKLSDSKRDAVLNKALTDIEKIEALSANIDLTSLGKDSGKASEAIKNLLDAELAELDARMDAGYIDFNDYINKRKDLIDDYYNKGKIKAKDYYDYLKAHYEKELSYMDKVISAVTHRIDKEIEGLEERKDKIEEYYNSEIEKLEEQKKLLQDQNDEKNRQLELEKALYNQRRAEEQRVIKLYTEEKGYSYVADPDAIRDASDEVREAELDVKIVEIEKQISKLEEAMKREVDVIQEQIDNLNEYKKQWQEVREQYEIQQNELIAQQILGADWENEILAGRMDILSTFRDDYIAIQEDIVKYAWWASQEQVKAAQAAADGKLDTYSVPPGSDDNGGNKHKYEVVYEGDASTVATYDNKLDADADAIKRSKGIPQDEPSYYVRKVFHTGLEKNLVGGNTSKDLEILQKYGLKRTELPAILEKSEAVINREQMANLAGNLRAIPILQDMVNTKFNYANNGYSRAVQPTVINNINASFPGITNEATFNRFEKFISNLSIDSMQYTNKR